MNKLSMHTPNLVEENVRKIAELFPNTVTERRNEQGQVERAVDFDALRQELSQALVEGPQERYQFTWPDKRQAVLLANAPISDTLRPCREESVDFDTTENLYIEGDNLNVLKLLRETYLGKVKMIYIDPPYNTGNDFVYGDDFKEDAGTYLGRSGQYDEEGNRLFQNTESNGRFHTDWLNMIYPRLRLAKDLLAEDGVIFISIDDNEQANLKKVCDEVFGERNFVANIIWQKKFSRSNDAMYFSTMHDHILCYAKKTIMNDSNGWRIGLLPRDNDIPAGYFNPDEDPRGLWTSVILSAKSGNEKLIYGISSPSGKVHFPPSGRYWSVSKERLNELIADNRIWFGKNADSSPRLKTFLSEVQKGIRPNTLFFHSEAGHNQEGKQETKELFNGIGVFDSPKPIRLLLLLLKVANTAYDDIVIDFFSGSATTAHAVMQLNAEDGGKRKFIMVQLPEATDEKSEAYKAGYKNICEIGKERIRRAGAKIREELKKENQQVKLDEEPRPLPDTGFRVLKLDSSNMKDVYYTPEETMQMRMEDLADNIKQDRTPEDLLFQAMLELGILPSSAIAETQLGGKRVFSVAGGFLLACFDSKINESTITEIAKLKPHYAVFRDSGQASDSVAINFEQIFKAYSPQTVRRVL